jgi:hypothetical protein
MEVGEWWAGERREEYKEGSGDPRESAGCRNMFCVSWNPTLILIEATACLLAWQHGLGLKAMLPIAVAAAVRLGLVLAAGEHAAGEPATELEYGALAAHLAVLGMHTGPGWRVGEVTLLAERGASRRRRQMRDKARRIVTAMAFVAACVVGAVVAGWVRHVPGTGVTPDRVRAFATAETAGRDSAAFGADTTVAAR